MADKVVRFDYFQVRCKKLNDKGELGFPLFNLEPLLSAAVGLTPQLRTYRHGEEDSRLQVIREFKEKIPSEYSARNKSGNYRFWELMFLRIRKDYVPGIATDEGEFDPLSLEDDEYVSEDASVLYDPTLHVIMIQRNRNSLSPTRIEEFFNQVIPDQGIVIQPLVLPEHFRKLTKGKYYKSIIIALSDLDSYGTGIRSSIGKIINSVRQLNGVKVEIKISLGTSAKKVSTLDYQQLKRSVKEVLGTKGLDRLELRVKESIDAKVETYDLIDERLMEGVSLSYSRQERITHERIFKKMVELYSVRLGKLKKIVKP